MMKKQKFSKTCVTILSIEYVCIFILNYDPSYVQRKVMRWNSCFLQETCYTKPCYRSTGETHLIPKNFLLRSEMTHNNLNSIVRLCLINYKKVCWYDIITFLSLIQMQHESDIFHQ